VVDVVEARAFPLGSSKVVTLVVTPVMYCTALYCLQDYEIDFISLSYTRSVDDVVEAWASWMRLACTTLKELCCQHLYSTSLYCLQDHDMTSSAWITHTS
jgi:hypothetical protein